MPCAPQKFNLWLDAELAEGPQNSLLVYPEGKRSQKEESLPLKRGMLRYAFTRRLPVQVRPACVAGGVWRGVAGVWKTCAVLLCCWVCELKVAWSEVGWGESGQVGRRAALCSCAVLCCAKPCTSLPRPCYAAHYPTLQCLCWSERRRHH